MLPLLLVYIVVVTLLAAYGLHTLWLLMRFWRHRERATAAPPALELSTDGAPNQACPQVLVQLPVYNERDVVARVVAAVGAFEWPANRLRIQLIDDGTDDSVALGARAIDALCSQGIDAQHVRRKDRVGFKAGGLAFGLQLDQQHPGGAAEFVAIFDADFVPAPDFLRRALPDLLADEGLAFVQGRWEHLNADQNLLTRAQAVGTDGHFAIEQAARSWSGLALNFNGTAGVWRVASIEDAGGWSHDTLTEDLDLSYRAQLAGWRAEFRFDLAVPAELPPTIESWRGQQFRWAKGSLQTARKLLPQVWRSKWSLTAKLAATAHMTHYAVHPLIVASLLLSPLVVPTLSRLPHSTLYVGTLLILVGMLPPMLLYGVGQAALGRPRRNLALLPALAAYGTGIAVANVRAAWEALRGVNSAFLRTPKYAQGPGSYRATPASGLPELAAAAWGLVGLAIAWSSHSPWIMPVMVLYVLGFACHGGALLVHRIRDALPTRGPSLSSWWPLLPLGAISLAGMSILAYLDTSWREQPVVFALVGLSIGASYLAALRLVRQRELGGPALGWILLVGLGLNLLGTGLWHSDDVNRYIVEGRQVAAGQNPYMVPPAAASARALVSADIAERVNHPEMTAIYPPLALSAHALVAAISPRPAGFTGAALMATLASLVLVLALLIATRQPPGWILAAAWNPVLPLFSVGEAHNDILMAGLVVAALLLAQRARGRLAVVVLSMAILVKPTALVALPLLLLTQHRRGWWLVPLMIALAYLPFADAGAGLVTSLGAFGGSMHFHGILEPLVRVATAPLVSPALHDITVRVILLMLLTIGLAQLWRRRGGAPLPTLTVRALGLLLLCLPTLHPWYFTVVVLLLPFAGNWSLALWTAMAPIYWLHGIAIQSSGVWVETPLVTALAHLPAVALMLHETLGPAREPRQPFDREALAVGVQ